MSGWELKAKGHAFEMSETVTNSREDFWFEMSGSEREQYRFWLQSVSVGVEYSSYVDDYDRADLSWSSYVVDTYVESCKPAAWKIPAV